MKKIALFLLIASGVVIWACNKTTTLPVNYVPTIFSVNSKVTHSKDSIVNSGDTIIFFTQGGIADTTGKYVISTTLKVTDTTGALNPITILYFKKVIPTYDTTGIATSGVYHWKASLSLPIPAVASKTGIKTTATFAYSLNLSSELGNLIGTDTKFIHVK
ncbi:MAG TPA: hypothetical protein VNS58_18515 [Puia sp.]|jgi:hypothetical protein|nr:hypothetical protein [Puia sp.]